MFSAPELPLVQQFIPTAPQDRVLKFSPNGAYFVASGSSYSGASPLTVYERETWKSVVTLSAVSFAFSPDSETLYLLQADSVERYDIGSRKVIATYLLPHGRPTHIAVSPSGKRIAVAITARSWEQFSDEVFIFSSKDGSEICRIETDQGRPEFVEFLDEGRICVAIGASPHASSEIHVFAADMGKHLLQLETPSPDPFKDSPETSTGDFFSHSPDGSRVATYTSGGDLLRMWNTADGSVCYDLPFVVNDNINRYERPHVWQSCFSPDGAYIATQESAMVSATNRTTRLRLWNVETGEQVTEIPWVSRYSPNHLAWDPRGELLATTGIAEGEEAILFWRFADNIYFAPLRTEGSSSATTVDFIGNDQVVWAGFNGVIHSGSIKSGNREIWAAVPPVFWQSPPAPEKESDETDEGYWDEEYPRQDRLTRIHQLIRHPDGKRLASVHSSGFVRLWDVETRTVLHELHAMRWNWDTYDPDLGEPILCGDFTADGRFLVTGGQDDTVRLWDVDTGQELLDLPIDGLEENNAIAQVAVVPGGEGTSTCVAVCDKHHEALQVWDLEAREKRSSVPAQDGDYGHSNEIVDSPQFSLHSGGKFAVLSNGSGNIRVYSLPQWELLHEVARDHGFSGPFAAAPRAAFVAVGTICDGIALHAIPSGKEIARADFRDGELLSLRFSPDGRYLAAGGAFGVVCIYDVSSLTNKNHPA